MADNIELGGKANDPISIGVELAKILPEEKEQVKPKPKVKEEVRKEKEKIPLANIERFHLNHQSLREVQFAIQVTTTFVVCALVAFTSNYASNLTAVDSQYLVPILGSLVITDTFGGTFILAIVCSIIFGIDCAFIALIQALGVGYQDYASSTILFFFVTFIIGFCFPNVALRKPVVLLPAVMFTVLVTTEPQYLTKNFIWTIYGGALIAMCFITAVSLLIFPRFACLEAQDRLGYTLSLAGEVFQLIDLAMMSTNTASASDYIFEAESLLENMKSNQLMLNARVGQSALEPKGFLRKYFRRHQSMFNRMSIPELGETSSSVLWHLQSALHAVKKIHFHKMHAVGIAECRDIFSRVHAKFKEVTKLIATATTKEPQDVTKINVAVASLWELCDKLGPILASSFLKKRNTHWNNNNNSNSNTIYREENFGEVTSSTVIDFDPLASTLNNGMTFSFYLFHMSEMIRLINEKFGSPELAKKAPPSKQPKKHVPFGTRLIIFFKRYGKEYTFTGLKTALILGVALIFVEVPYLEKKFEHGK